MTDKSMVSTSYIERNHKSSLFELVFGTRKEDALSLYNAINGSNYTNADDLILLMNDGRIFIGMKYDVGFLFENTFSLYEHQSSYNPNMPLRGMIYFADSYKKLIGKQKKIYGSKLIKIPNPKYIVFYNGHKYCEDRFTMKLSDAFYNRDDSNEYQWTAHVININYGRNRELMESCKRLDDYAFYVDRVYRYSHDMPLHDAIQKTIDDCKAEERLTDIITKHREELEEMSIWYISEEELIEIFKEEGYEEGHEEGLEAGRAEGLEAGRAEGREEGREEERQSIIERLRKIGVSEEVIERVCAES